MVKSAGGRGHRKNKCWGNVQHAPHDCCAHTLECFDGCLLLRVLLNVSKEELLVIFHMELFQILNSVGVVEQYRITSPH